MRLSDRILAVAFVPALLLIEGCSSEDAGVGAGDEGLELFASQVFSDNFDTGTPDTRWGCTFPDLRGYFCSWEVAGAGDLDPMAETATADSFPSAITVGVDNFVFQSPDPEALDLNRSFSCERFSAEFEQAGTFAFNYFVNTAGSVGFQDGNYLEVNYVRNIVEFDPVIEEELIVDSETINILKVSGNESDRSITSLPPGNYDFEFCYLRNRTFNIGPGFGPDFVQVDDVETCVGTVCAGERPKAKRCRADQGQTLVPDISKLPIETFTINRVQGTTNRYYVIIDTDFLAFISGGLLTNNSAAAQAFRAEVDGVRDLALVDGRTCDVDTRRSLLIEMSRAEVIDLVLSTGIITDLLDQLETALANEAGDAALNQLIQSVQEKILSKILEELVKALARAI